MTCYHPVTGFKSQALTKNGKRQLTFSTKKGYADLPVTVPCGQCIGCRLDRSRKWAVRCMHEAQLHEFKCFITLTYDDKHLPEGRTLVMSHFQTFMKRLRKHFGLPIRFFHCGEYGELDQRPHYHALLFGCDFPDKKQHSKNSQGQVVYKSETLEKLWGKGFCTIGELNYQTAAYTARYIMKKVTGEKADNHYTSVDLDSGEIFRRVPEYITMSRRPGIGMKWYEKFSSDLYPDDFTVVQGKKMGVPRFYDKQLEKEDESEYQRIKRKRIVSAAKRKFDNTPERLAVKEQVKLSKISQLKRTL